MQECAGFCYSKSRLISPCQCQRKNKRGALVILYFISSTTRSLLKKVNTDIKHSI